MIKVELQLRGPDRFCPDCGRWLVKVKHDGKFDLASQTGINVQMDIPDEQEDTIAVESYLWDACCLKCNPEEER